MDARGTDLRYYRADVVLRDGMGEVYTMTYWGTGAVSVAAAEAAVRAEEAAYCQAHPDAADAAMEREVLSVTLS